MQRTRDWRRAQWYKHNFHWPFTKYIDNVFPYQQVKNWPFRYREELGGDEFNANYNRSKYKKETREVIERSLLAS